MNLDFVQNNLLNQIKVVFKNQIFPLWIDSDVYLFVKTGISQNIYTQKAEIDFILHVNLIFSRI